MGRGKSTKGDCTLEWCSKKEYAKGLCSTHYERQRKGLHFVDPRASKPLCAGPECDRESSTTGLCSTHYAQKYAGKNLTPIVSPWRVQNRGDQRMCRTCQQWKDHDQDFYDTTKKNGKQGECKTCLIKRARGNRLALEERRKNEAHSGQI